MVSIHFFKWSLMLIMSYSRLVGSSPNNSEVTNATANGPQSGRSPWSWVFITAIFRGFPSLRMYIAIQVIVSLSGNLRRESYILMTLSSLVTVIQWFRRLCTICTKGPFCTLNVQFCCSNVSCNPFASGNCLHRIACVSVMWLSFKYVVGVERSIVSSCVSFGPIMPRSWGSSLL